MVAADIRSGDEAKRIKPRSASSVAPEFVVLDDLFWRRERRIFRFAVAIPFIGLLIAPWHTAYYGMTTVELVLLLFMSSVSGIGIEVGYHRLFSHGSFQAVSALRVALGVAGATAGQGPIVYWCSNHRRHHSHPDQPGDPHSPHLFGSTLRDKLAGFWHSHVGWFFGPERTLAAHFGRDLINDRDIRIADRWYYAWFLGGILLPGPIAYAFTGSLTAALGAFLWAGLARASLAQHLTYAINSLCHIVGTRPFETGDHARNNALMVVPTWGSSWHNNHHAFPSSARVGLLAWQLDPGWWLIRFWSACGWVWDAKQPSPSSISAKRRRPR